MRDMTLTVAALTVPTAEKTAEEGAGSAGAFVQDSMTSSIGNTGVMAFIRSSPCWCLARQSPGMPSADVRQIRK
jgi:hypothetical protein